MAAATLNLDNITTPGCNYAVERGATFDILRLFHPENVSLYTPCGQIKDNYDHLAGSVLAEFTFEPLVYGLVTLPDNTQGNRTLIVPSLTAAQTSLITPTKDRISTDKIIVGRNAYVYDIKLQAPTGEIIKLVAGIVQVVPDVSDCLIP